MTKIVDGRDAKKRDRTKETGREKGNGSRDKKLEWRGWHQSRRNVGENADERRRGPNCLTGSREQRLFIQEIGLGRGKYREKGRG